MLFLVNMKYSAFILLSVLSLLKQNLSATAMEILHGIDGSMDHGSLSSMSGSSSDSMDMETNNEKPQDMHNDSNMPWKFFPSKDNLFEKLLSSQSVRFENDSGMPHHHLTMPPMSTCSPGLFCVNLILDNQSNSTIELHHLLSKNPIESGLSGFPILPIDEETVWTFQVENKNVMDVTFTLQPKNESSPITIRTVFAARHPAQFVSTVQAISYDGAQAFDYSIKTMAKNVLNVHVTIKMGQPPYKRIPPPFNAARNVPLNA